MFSRIRCFFRNLTGRRDVERDLAAEVDSYVDLSTQQKVRGGLSETEARRQALVELEGAEQVKELVKQKYSEILQSKIIFLLSKLSLGL